VDARNVRAPFPGPVRQFGYVVADLDDALSGWLAAGVGPWYVMRGLRQSCRYRGEPCEVTLSIGLASIGGMQIEVIQQEDRTPSVYREFLDSGRHGFHQLAWWVDDFEAALQAAQERGWPVVWSGGEDVGIRYAYLEPTWGPAAVFELIANTDLMAGVDRMIREATAAWDGSDPVRVLG
jgi:hypothetical protein